MSTTIVLPIRDQKKQARIPSISSFSEVLACIIDVESEVDAAEIMLAIMVALFFVWLVAVIIRFYKV